MTATIMYTLSNKACISGPLWHVSEEFFFFFAISQQSSYTVMLTSVANLIISPYLWTIFEQQINEKCMPNIVIIMMKGQLAFKVN